MNSVMKVKIFDVNYDIFKFLVGFGIEVMVVVLNYVFYDLVNNFNVVIEWVK